LELPDKV